MDRHPYPNPGYRTESPIYCDTGNKLVWLPICMCLTKDVRKNIAHSFIQVWIGWCRSASCRGVVIEDGVVASSSVVLNCTVLLSVAFWGTRVWLYLGLSRNDGVRVDSWECWLPFTCRARRMSTRMSSDSWDQAFRDSGDNRPNVSLGITPDWSRICACTMSVGVSISNPNSYASWKDSVTLASQISVRSANLVGWRFAGAWARY
jgi:hypothetical protein